MMNCPTLEQAPLRSRELLGIRGEHADDWPMRGRAQTSGGKYQRFFRCFLVLVYVNASLEASIDLVTTLCSSVHKSRIYVFLTHIFSHRGKLNKQERSSYHVPYRIRTTCSVPSTV